MCSTISFGNATQSYILYWWSGPSQSLSFWEFWNSSQTCYGFHSWLHVCISFLLSLQCGAFIWAKAPRGWPLIQIYSASFHELDVPFPGILLKICFYLSWVFHSEKSHFFVCLIFQVLSFWLLPVSTQIQRQAILQYQLYPIFHLCNSSFHFRYMLIFRFFCV